MRKFNILLTIFLLCIVVNGCKERDYVELATDNETKSVMKTTSTGVFVYITGQVENPGVYEVAQGTRLYQVVELAGGLTKKAKKTAINLAEEVSDGQSIHIPSKAEEKSKENTTDLDSQLININHATAEQLMDLPGIGESKALAIITYREDNGDFSCIEDVKNVSGIGDATYNNLKDLITI